MIKNIFFDFDGVLAESVNVKTEAFKSLYLPFGSDVAEKVVDYHLANGGVSRFEKIKYFHNIFLNQDITEEEVLQWADKFSELVLEAVVNAPEVLGALDFLKKNYTILKYWVITGTPTTEIREIIQKRNWTNFFIEAFGAPEKKTHWTEYILEANNLKREETIFVGDALTDYEAAKSARLQFVLRRTEENKPLFKEYTGWEINHLYELKDVMIQINNQ